ncbi:MAG: iron-sulfur cluster assembly accessory protein [Betaproteobacteria bacterium AqS2]|uniref:Iron-sulfur cluster assembly accessory protein n=1 Tax=Candidatus Amphirhobacter heronislandensis TaxID=1732024 RepID=A0A930UFB4_9GAMM|nr:iron-sulfur cluster assembly accessory protein [Betaproteobacteria bacterium AqS2]
MAAPALALPAAAAGAAELRLTAAAVAHVKRFADEHGRAAAMRIGVRTSSCSAFAYTFELKDDAAPEDFVVECDGVRVIIDPKSHSFLAGTEIDYQREGIQEGFAFNNPNVKGTCGCGESFTV